MCENKNDSMCCGGTEPNCCMNRAPVQDLIKHITVFVQDIAGIVHDTAGMVCTALNELLDNLPKR